MTAIAEVAGRRLLVLVLGRGRVHQGGGGPQEPLADDGASGDRGGLREGADRARAATPLDALAEHSGTGTRFETPAGMTHLVPGIRKQQGQGERTLLSVRDGPWMTRDR